MTRPAVLSRARRPRPRLAAGLVLLALLAAATTAGAGRRDEALDRAQALIDEGDAGGALSLIRGVLDDRPQHPRALLLRSTARFMQGDLAGGASDLEQALERDPGLRQGWLNLAGLRISQNRLDDALGALDKAAELDPGNPDNDLNQGAVLALQGDAEGARRHFRSYLGPEGGTAQDHYLVATNYTVAALDDDAVEQLREAVERDETMRLRARTDPAFGRLESHPGFVALLETDAWRPPDGYHTASRAYLSSYGGGRGPLLQAVLDTLQLSRIGFDPRVEVTASWALIQGDARIKVRDDGEGGGIVELSAPPGRFTPAAWAEASRRLLDAIETRAGGGGG